MRFSLSIWLFAKVTKLCSEFLIITFSNLQLRSKSVLTEILILFACDTGVGNIYKEIGDKYGPIDINIINIGAYNFYPMTPNKDKSSYHTSPEEALEISRDLKSKKVIGMHWGTFVLSLEPIMEPRERFRDNAEKYGFKKEDALVFKIGQITPLNEILK